MAHLVYFSSVSENTHRFVQKLARASEARGEGPVPPSGSRCAAISKSTLLMF